MVAIWTITTEEVSAYRKTYEWLTKFEDAEKNGVEILSSVSNGQSCMESDSNDDPPCEVPGGLNFCGDKNVKFDILAAQRGYNTQSEEHRAKD